MTMESVPPPPVSPLVKKSCWLKFCRVIKALSYITCCVHVVFGFVCQVHGIIRRSSSFNTGRIEHLYSDPKSHQGGIHLHYGDLTDSTCLVKIFSMVKPSEVYNLGAMSHVKVDEFEKCYINMTVRAMTV